MTRTAFGPNPIEQPMVTRRVVSFVRRSARMRPPQRRAWESQRHRYLVEVERDETSTSVAAGPLLDLATVFGRDSPADRGDRAGDRGVVGAHGPAASRRQPAGLRGLPASVGEGDRLPVAAADLEHVRVVEADAVDGLSHLLPPESIDSLWMFFPDPWPKARHHKRRILSPAFADLAASRLKPGASWRLATDWEHYAGQMRGVLDAHPRFRNEHRRLGSALVGAADHPLRAARTRRRPARSSI